MRTFLKLSLCIGALLSPLTFSVAFAENDHQKSVVVAKASSDDYFLQEYEGKGNLQVSAFDPIEPWNRLWFGFNDYLYYWVLKPVSQGYSEVVPEGGRIAVRNFFNNLTTPVRVVNTLLQGEVQQSGVELGRFGINTVLGVGGLFDVADERFNLDRHDEDLGQTLGVYGVGSGPYLVWPVLGPSSARDTVGMVGDYFLDPMAYYPYEVWTNVGVRTYKVVNLTSLRIGEYEQITSSAMDPYLSIRDAYLQYRVEKVKE